MKYYKYSVYLVSIVDYRRLHFLFLDKSMSPEYHRQGEQRYYPPVVSTQLGWSRLSSLGLLLHIGV